MNRIFLQYQFVAAAFAAAAFLFAAHAQPLVPIGDIDKDAPYVDSDSERLLIASNEEGTIQFYMVSYCGGCDVSNAVEKLDLGETESVKLYDGILYVYRDGVGQLDVYNVENLPAIEPVQTIDYRGGILAVSDHWAYQNALSFSRLYQRKKTGELEIYSEIDSNWNSTVILNDHFFDVLLLNQLRRFEVVNQSLELKNTILFGFPTFGGQSLCAPQITEMKMIDDVLVLSTVLACVDTGRPPDGPVQPDWMSHLGGLVFVKNYESDSPMIYMPDITNRDQEKTFIAVTDFEIYDRYLLLLAHRRDKLFPQVQIWRRRGLNLEFVDEIEMPYSSEVELALIHDWLIVSTTGDGIHFFKIQLDTSDADEWQVYQ